MAETDRKIDDEEESKFDQTKEELGLEDDDIRSIREITSPTKRGVIKLIGTDEEKKTAYLTKELNKRDQEKIKRAQACVENAIEIYLVKGEEEYKGRYKFNKRYHKKQITEKYNKLKEVCGDDIQKWEIVEKTFEKFEHDKYLSVYISYVIDFLKTLFVEGSWERKMTEEALKEDPELAQRIAKAGGHIAKIKDIFKDNPEKLKKVLDLAKESYYSSILVLMEAKDVYKDNEARLGQIIEFLKKEMSANKYDAIKILIKAKDIYENNEKRFLALLKILEEKDPHIIVALAKAKDAYGDDDEKFNTFVDVGMKYNGYNVIKALARAKIAYGDNEERFKIFAELAESGECRAIVALTAARVVYKDDDEKFKDFAGVLKRVISEYSGKNTAEILHELKVASKIYKDDEKRFKTFLKLAESKKREKGDFSTTVLIQGKDTISTQTAASVIYGEDNEKFEKIANIIEKEEGIYMVQTLIDYANEKYKGDDKKIGLLMDVAMNRGHKAFKAFVENEFVYRNNDERLEKLATLTIGKGIDGLDLMWALHGIYGHDDNKFNEYIRVAENQSQEINQILAQAKPIYKNNENKFNVLKKLAEKGKGYEVVTISEAADIIEDSDEVFKIYIKLAEEKDAASIKNINQAKEVFNKDPDKLKMAIAYFELTKIYDQGTLEEYIKIFKRDGEDQARTFIKELPGKAKGLIGSESPLEHRKLPEYKYLVKVAFPAGNYSNHKKNLACGDKLEHLEGYEFDKEGYPTTMTGLLGYRIKEGQQEDQELLEQYTGRINKINRFISQRGPEDESLLKDFDEQVDKLFQKKALKEFQENQKLNTKEKLLALFITEAINKSNAGKGYVPNTEILDLAVKYKYVYQENMGEYVRGSADIARAQKDEITQSYMLWSELSTIYGENVKHILRHDILEEIAGDSENYPKLIEAYRKSLKLETKGELKENQIKRLNDAFDNPKIPQEKKLLVLKQKLWGIFFKTIKFKTDEEKKHYEEKFNEIIAPLKDKLDKETLKEVIPHLFSLRKELEFDVNTKLEELFSLDINKIFTEIAKYEELVEEEKVKKKIGEQEVKKSTKKRNIRGYFTKTQETANARMGAHVCIAGDSGMWKNENYFELVMEDEKTGECVGLAMLLKIEAEDGKKYLWFGPNPFESFLDKVSSEKCYDYIYSTVCKFAEKNNFNGVVVPSEENQIHGACTNRGGDFPSYIKKSRLRDKKGKLKIVEFGKEHELSGNYKYKNGALIWSPQSRQFSPEHKSL